MSAVAGPAAMPSTVVIGFARHLLALFVFMAVPSMAIAEAVVAAMNSVTPAVRSYGNGWRGLVPTRFVFEGAT